MSVITPYARPLVTAEDVRAVTECLERQYLTQGEELACFELELRELFGVEHAIVCNSGTAALHLAYLGLRLGPERGLVTSAITFLATANAARMCNAPVAFSDVDHVTGNMTPETARAAIRSAPFPVAVLVPVHLGGRPCDMEGLRAVADEFDVALVEDACHAPLARYGAEGAFSVGDCEYSNGATFSFHAIKHVAMGEGGVLVTNDIEVANRARLLRNHGMVRDPEEWQAPPEENPPWYYEMHDFGWNYRASELQCALGRSQLKRLSEGLLIRQHQAARYQELLGDHPYLRTPRQPDRSDAHSWHLYSVSVDFVALGKTRGDCMRELAELGVGTQVHYIPLHLQPYYRGEKARKFPGAEHYYSRTLSLPLYVGLEERDLVRIANLVKDVVRIS